MIIERKALAYKPIARLEASLGVIDLAFSPDGKLLISAESSESDGAIGIRSENKLLKRIEFEKPINSIAFEPPFLAVSYYDEIKILDLSNPSEPKEISKIDFPASDVEFFDGLLYAIDNFGNLIEASTEVKRRTKLEADSLIAGERLIAYSGDKGVIYILDPKELKPLKKIEVEEFFRSALSPDGKLLAIGSLGFISIRSLPEAKLVKRIESPSIVVSLAFTSNEVLLSADKKISIRHLSEPTLVAQLEAHKNRVTSIAVSRERVATGESSLEGECEECKIIIREPIAYKRGDKIDEEKLRETFELLLSPSIENIRRVYRVLSKEIGEEEARKRIEEILRRVF